MSTPADALDEWLASGNVIGSLFGMVALLGFVGVAVRYLRQAVKGL